ncbi:MAG: SagB/ThcOx family dehydrogenase [Cyanobacteria bacterium P01_F01_bin.143]
MNSIAYHYHQRTKYDPETIATKGKSLDWSKQPTPYKEYKIGHSFDLKPYLSQEKTGDDKQYDEEWLRLSLFLLCSYGLTAQLQTIYGDPIYLRAAPSAGGLYPAEVYLISRGTPWLPAGLYNYQVATHSLVHFWENTVWSQLQAACFNHPVLKENQIALVTTAVFERSAWRYEDRAYRRVFLDTGHLLGNIELSAASNKYKAHFIGGFCDEAINDILYLDGEIESAIAVVSLLDTNKNSVTDFVAPTALPSATVPEYPKIPDGQLLHYLHQKTNIDTEPKQIAAYGSTPSLEDKYNFPFCSKISTIAPTTIDWGDQLSELENTILQRRSTRNYTGADLTLDELKSLLNFTYQPQDYLAQGLDGTPDYFALDLLETFIAVSGIQDLEAGCYYYAPQAQELRQIRFKNFRRELHYLCLGQELGRDAAAIVFQTADLTKAIAKYGDRAYRYLHLDAGHLGQRLNLAAIRLKLGVSGIGGFFDDRVNQVLDIPQEEAVIYLTTLGRP